MNSKNRRLIELTESAHKFVEDVAHEFRTPLSVIKEFASIIADGLGGEVSVKQKEFLNHITGSAGDLAGLIDDFLNSSRLRSNSIRVDRRVCEVDRVIETALPILHSRAASRSIQLSVEIENNLPEIYVDADKMQRSLINLVVNAIKFSDNGSEVCIRASMNDEYSVRVGVHDFGSGLPEDSVDELFKRFNQGDADERKLATGFGLGFNIVKEMVTINLGSVDIQSELSQGSVFSFSAPLMGTKSVVHEYLANAVRDPENTRVVVMSVQRESPDFSTEELVHDLKNMCYPMDTVLNSEQTGEVFMMGITEDVDAWSVRLIDTDLRIQRQSESPRSGLVVEVCGSWDSQHAEPFVLGLLEGSMKGGSAYASISADS